MPNYIATPGQLRMGVQIPSIKPSAMWSKAWFVDYDNGNDGNTTVNDPNFPMKTLTGALAKMGRGDVVYLRPRPYSGTDPQRIPDAAVVPVALQGISIIGTGPHVQGFANPFDMQINASGTGAILTIRAPQVAVENVSFHIGSATGSLVKVQSASTDATKQAWGVNFFNCHFRRCAALANAGGAIDLDNTWHANIEQCLFANNATGIFGHASVDSLHDINIRNCQFESDASTAGNTAADIDCHISMAALLYGVLINGCFFTGPVPTGLAGAIVSRYITLTGATYGMVSNCFFNDTGLTFGAAGTGALIPTTVGIVNCYQEAANNASPLVRT